MGGISDTFTPLSLIYLFGAGYTVFQMAKGWRQLLSGRLTPFNRRLASGIAFFLLVPVGVLLRLHGPFLPTACARGGRRRHARRRAGYSRSGRAGTPGAKGGAEGTPSSHPLAVPPAAALPCPRRARPKEAVP